MCRYRLSDIVRGWGSGAEACACAFGPNRLGCRYSRGGYGPNNLTALAALVASHLSGRPWLRADNRFTYIHVRAGDGIRGPDCFHNVSDCRPSYGQDLSFFESIPLKRRRKLFVIVATTTHVDHPETPPPVVQAQYIESVLKFFRRKGPTIARVNEDPDDDFALLSTAKSIRITGGYFGRLARDLRDTT